MTKKVRLWKFVIINFLLFFPIYIALNHIAIIINNDFFMFYRSGSNIDRLVLLNIIAPVSWTIAMFLTVIFYAKRRKIIEEFVKKLCLCYLIVIGLFSIIETLFILSRMDESDFVISRIVSVWLGTFLIIMSARGLLLRVLRQQTINSEKFNDFNLIIYFMNPSRLAQVPVSEYDLISGMYDHKLTVSGELLKEHANLLGRLKKIKLKSVETKSALNTRLLYVFKDKNDKEVLSVSMWGENNSMFVNGEEVKEEKILYDVIIPFLPEDVAEVVRSKIKKHRVNKIIN